MCCQILQEKYATRSMKTSPKEVNIGHMSTLNPSDLKIAVPIYKITTATQPPLFTSNFRGKTSKGGL